MRHPAKVFVAAVSVLALLLTGFAWHSVDTLRSSLTTTGGLGLGAGADGAIDILLVGIDSRTDAQGNPLSQHELEMLHAGNADATNTDTIILIRIPEDGSSATAVSIPRDSYVRVPGLGKSKINAAYGETKALTTEKLLAQGADEDVAEKKGTDAGRHALVGAVHNLTGITVDHYAEVGLLGFVLLTDAVGGVPVCLNAPVDDPYSGADFPAGRQTLDGAQALRFVRQRHGLPRGDLDRIVRQQAFLASLAHEVLSAKMLASPSKLNDLSSAIGRSIVVDPGWDAIDFARKLQNISGGDVTFRTIPVADPAGTSPDGESIVRVDTRQVHRFFDGLVDGGDSGGAGDSGEQGGDDREHLDVDPSRVSVSVLNSTTVRGLASSVSSALTTAGYPAGKVANYTGAPTTTSSVRVPPDEEDAGRAVARALGGLDVRTDGSVPDGSVAVVLAEDYTGPGSAQWSGTVVSGVDATSRPSGSGTSGPSSGSASGAAGASPSGGGSGGSDGSGDSGGEASPAVDAGGDGPRCVN